MGFTPLPTKDRRRAAGELNLVAYIDLLTCLIAFLLITAVWTQLARLQVRQHGSGGDQEAGQPKKVVVMVGDRGFNVVVDQDREVLPRRDQRYDFAALGAALRRLKSALPDQEELVVSSEDGVAFETVVGAMDTALSAGFPALSLVGVDQAGL